MIPQIVILFLHWLGDFVFQSDTVAKGKSKFVHLLVEHTIIYSLVVGIGMIGFRYYLTGNFEESCLFGIRFALITGVFHTIQDYFTSKLNARLYAEGKNHLFYVSLGFDQFLHACQLFLTYKYLLLWQH